ncbi:hypothetical protein ACHWQZ_G006250 [Mnemiopsis leidyi]
MGLSFLLTATKAAVFVLLSRISQLLVTILFGPSNSDKKSNGVLCYDVLCDWKFFALQGGDPSLFTLKFTGVKDLTWLDRDDVTLYHVTEKEFFFVRSKSGVDIHDAGKHPFLYVVKHDTAAEVGTVAREVIVDYLRGSGRMDRDGSNISILHNIGRCGSTLVTSMVSKTKQCHVLSEPIALMDVVNILTNKERAITRDAVEYFHLLKEVLVLLTPDPDKKYFIKTHSQIIYLLPLFHQVMPGMKEAYMHRAMRPTVTSMLRAFSDMGPFWIMEKIFIPQMPKNVQKLWLENRVAEFGNSIIIMTLANIHLYLNETKDRNDMKSFSYESLVADKYAFCKSLFQELGIGVEHVDLALTAMEKDSQKNSVISKAKTGASKVEVTEEALEWGKTIGRTLGVEMDGHDYRISNIQHSWNSQT